MLPCGPLPAVGLVFNTAKDFIDGAKEHANKNGYDLVISRQNPNSRNPSYISLRCSKGRTYKADKRCVNTEESKRRQGSTQMCGCPALIAARKRQDGLWVVEACPGSKQSPVDHSKHNHEAVESPSVFPAVRQQLLQAQKAEILRLWNSGIRPTKILTSLRADSQLLGIRRSDILNLIAKHRSEELRGRTPIEWLYDTLREQSDSYWFSEKRDTEGRLQFLFVAPQSGIVLYRLYPYVLKLECTYKTNRFNMPLLNMCGTTSFRSAPNLGCCLMSSETEAAYAWAFHQLSELMAHFEIPAPECVVSDRELALMTALNRNPRFGQIPHILCHWHINMNVLAKTKRFFPAGTRAKGTGQVERHPDHKNFLKAWKNLCCCANEDTFQQELEKFQREGMYPLGAVQYVLNTWILPWKEKIVAYWTNQVSLKYFLYFPYLFWLY